MNKKATRDLYREKRKNLSPLERNKLDDLLLIRFQACNLPFLQSLLSYWPIQKNAEPDTHLFTDHLAFCNPGMVIAYPKTNFAETSMTAIIPGDGDEFVINKFDLYEPASGLVLEATDIDMVFVPLLAFDKKGYRVGYGKGFYDRFLSGCRTDCIKAAFSYFEPVDQLIDKEDFDVPLNLCITPQTVYVF